MTKKRQAAGNASEERLVVAVISDVHAYEGKDIKPDEIPSHCCITESDPMKNSLVGLHEFIKRESLSADVLLCAGDIGDKAQTIAVQHTWRELHETKKLLGATVLAAATGNHDIDSRHDYNKFDAKGMLQALKPPYPFDDEGMNDRYWSRHFELIAHNEYRILVLNSSAFHGEGQFDQTNQYEYEHGRVSEHTLRKIRERLDAHLTPPVNILLCHHHPHPHSEIGLGRDDLMIGGDALLSLLNSGTYGRWLVIHGHKHHPKLENAAGGASAPIVFAAGSLARFLYGELQANSRNQFYIIDFPYEHFAQFGFVGSFRAWDWRSGHGWRPASNGSELPANGGFGWRGDIGVLAGTVDRAVESASIPWTDIVSKLPELKYLLPLDLDQLVRRLQDNPALIVQPENDVPPTLIGRAK